MWQWFKKHTGWLAIGFGAVALVLAVVVAIQADLLYDGGSRLVLGTVPEWLSGIGAFATFAVVWVAVQQLGTASCIHTLNTLQALVIDSAGSGASVTVNHLESKQLELLNACR